MTILMEKTDRLREGLKDFLQDKPEIAKAMMGNVIDRTGLNDDPFSFVIYTNRELTTEEENILIMFKTEGLPLTIDHIGKSVKHFPVASLDNN